MSSFQDAFIAHFHSEIRTIASLSVHLPPSTPSTSSPDVSPSLPTLFKTWGKRTLTLTGYTLGPPFFLLNHDMTFEEGMWAGWPPMPAAVRWGLVNVVGAYHCGWWKFASCDSGGRPRGLYAVGVGVDGKGREEVAEGKQ